MGDKIVRIEPIMQSDPAPGLIAFTYWNDKEPKISSYIATRNLFLLADHAEQIGRVNLGKQKLWSQRKHNVSPWRDLRANIYIKKSFLILRKHRKNFFKLYRKKRELKLYTHSA